MISNLIGCQMSDVFRAIAPMSGMFNPYGMPGSTLCANQRHIPMATTPSAVGHREVNGGD